MSSLRRIRESQIHERRNQIHQNVANSINTHLRNANLHIALRIVNTLLYMETQIGFQDLLRIRSRLQEGLMVLRQNGNRISERLDGLKHVLLVRVEPHVVDPIHTAWNIEFRLRNSPVVLLQDRHEHLRAP